MIIPGHTHGLAFCRLLCIAGVIAGCGSVEPGIGEATSHGVTSSSIADSPLPCSFLTQAIAAQMSDDTAVTNQAYDVSEPGSGYVACIFADTTHEANSAEVQIKRLSAGVDATTLQAAASFFSAGEPVQPFQPFPVVGIGDRALGETTPGVAFVVFAAGDHLVYVGAHSASMGTLSSRVSVERLAREIAATL